MIKRIIIHWSAGKYYPTEYEKKFYHYLVDKEGNVCKGIYSPQDNYDCSDGYYAAHTGGGNTNSIGICMCAMLGFYSSDNVGNYPITKIQFEACMKFVAELCKTYNLSINQDTVLTHYEFGRKYPSTTSRGKIDIIWLPPYPTVKTNEVGAFIRNKICWYRSKI